MRSHVVAGVLVSAGLLAVSCAIRPGGSVTLPASAGHAAPAAASGPDGSAAHPLPWGATYHGQNVDLTVAGPHAVLEHGFSIPASATDLTLSLEAGFGGETVYYAGGL